VSFSWDSYIEFARELKGETDEAKLRTSVSRGYYGVYHKSRIRLGKISKQYVKHEDVIAELRESEKFENGNRLANTLDNLKKDRVDADYDSFKTVTPHTVDVFWKRLDRFIITLNEEE